jgi:hypothetical protein
MDMPKKQLVVEALIDLHRRLSTLPTRSHERRMIMQETATLYGVDPTVVSPAAKAITREPIASSCRDQQRRKTFNSRFPYDRPWRHGFPYIVWTIADGILVATIALSENKCLATPLLPRNWHVLNGKSRSHPRFHAQQVR